MLLIQPFSVSNLGSDTGHRDFGFRGFPQSLQTNSGYSGPVVRATFSIAQLLPWLRTTELVCGISYTQDVANVYSTLIATDWAISYYGYLAHQE